VKNNLSHGRVPAKVAIAFQKVEDEQGSIASSETYAAIP
jgi:hypothetical protein